MKPHFNALSDPGLKRKENEDFYLMDESLGLYLICDGMGGHASGQLASETCARAVKKFLEKELEQTKKNPRDALKRAIELANEEVHALSKKAEGAQGMGTTCSALLVRDTHAFLAHVGDSRIYLIRSNKTHQLTLDHKVGAEMVRQGGWTLEAAKKSPYANVLTRAVGPAPFVQVDTFELELSEDDLFLLCSDGLSDYLGNGNILQEKVSVSKTTQSLVESLIDYAKRSGGHDNITTIAVKMVEPTQSMDRPISSSLKADVLSKIPLFSFLAYAEIIKFLNASTTRTLSAGQYLIGNEPGAAHPVKDHQEMFVVLKGEVAIMKGAEVIATKRDGDTVGEMVLLDGAPRSAEVVAKKSTTVLAFPRQKVLEVLRTDPGLATKLLWAMNLILVQRLRETTEELATARANLRKLGAADLPFVIPEIQVSGG